MSACVTEETLQAYFDGELAPTAAAQVIKHLAECDSCAGAAFELERAIELMASAWETELPELAPTEHLRNRIAAALAGKQVTAQAVRGSRRFWPRILDATLARLNRLRITPRRLAYAGLAAIALICALWLGARGRFTSQNVQQARNETPGAVSPAPAAAVNATSDGVEKNVVAGSNGAASGRWPPAPKRELRAKREAPPHRLPNERVDQSEIVADAGESVVRPDSGVFDPEMIRHFEKAQIVLRSFKNSDPTGGGFAADLANEKRQSKSLLYQNILLRRNAESNGNLPAEGVMASLEPILLDIANLPERPAPDEVRAIKDRMHRSEIIGVLQVYSAPWVAANY